MSFRIKHFLQQQGLNLLPNSGADWMVGYKFEWDKPVIRQKAKVEPIFITDVLFQDANEPNFINEEERKTFVSGFKKLNQKNSKANFNAIDVEKKHEFEVAVSLPNFGASGTFNLDFEKIKKMTIKGVEYRSVKGNTYYNLRENLAYLKREYPKKYKQIDGLMYIQELWYANTLQLDVFSDYASQLELAFRKAGVDFTTAGAVVGGGTAKLTVNLRTDCPFAVRTKEIEDLLD